MATTKTINRVTLFKIPEIADQQRLLEIYKEMPSKAKKVTLLYTTTPTILKLDANPLNTGRETIYFVSFCWTNL